MTDTFEIKEALRTFILDEYLPGEERSELKDDTPLITSGILDSLATLGVVSFVEQQFDIEVEAHEAGVAHFETIEDIADFVTQKMVAKR
jgi:acyl carrier protein